jgi:hypothetical protein
MASFQDGRQGRPRLRPARGTAIKVQTIITSTFAGLVTGAALMYVLDSEGGRRRRARQGHKQAPALAPRGGS